MGFELKNKVALVTGSASGIGLEFAKELLRQGLKGVTIADINLENGEKIVKELNTEFGPNKVVFVLTDVSNSTSFENAFKVTVNNFKNIDILLNNAGMFNDKIWEKEIDVNLKGPINGMILGMQKYLNKYKQGNEAVIVNTASLAALIKIPVVPIYSATKKGVLAATECWGTDFYYETTKVRVLAICPGFTDTPMTQAKECPMLEPKHADVYEQLIAEFKSMQSPSFVAKETLKLIREAPNGSTWVIDDTKPAYRYIFPDTSDFKNNTLK